MEVIRIPFLHREKELVSWCEFSDEEDRDFIIEKMEEYGWELIEEDLIVPINRPISAFIRGDSDDSSDSVCT